MTSGTGEIPLIDIHNHLLYGIDDGAATSREMFAMLNEAAAQGVRMIIATPHVQPGVIPFDEDKYSARIKIANDYCKAKGYQLEVYPGSEILYTTSAVRLLRKKVIPSMCGTSHVLVEWPVEASKEEIRNALRELTNAGFVPIIAHVERLWKIYRDCAFLADIRNTFGVRIQVDCDTVIEDRFGWKTGALFKQELVDYVASDAHGTAQRKMRIDSAFQIIKRRYGEETARKVMSINPDRILLG